MFATTRSGTYRIPSAPSMLLVCILLSFAGLAVPTAHATFYTLIDGNAYANIDTGAQATVYDWHVFGKDQLKELSNWYRVGGGSAETSVHNLIITSESLSDLNNDGDDDFLTVEYLDTELTPRFSLAIDYYITGNILGEEIRITNLHSSLPLSFHFFEYVDLDLNKTPNDDVASFPSANSVEQNDGIVFVEGTYDADHREIDEIDLSSDTLDALGDGASTTLSDTPATGFVTSAGDMSWALQWDFVGSTGTRPAIPANSTVVIPKQWELRTVIPEPASGVLGAFGGLVLLAVGRRRR